MDLVKKIFPHAFKSTDVSNFIVALIIYAVIEVVGGIVIGWLAKLPIIGLLFGLTGSLVGLYATAGIVLSILVFVKVLK